MRLMIRVKYFFLLIIVTTNGLIFGFDPTGSDSALLEQAISQIDEARLQNLASGERSSELLSGAEAILDSLAVDYPNSFEVYKGLGTINALSGNYAGAVDRFNMASSFDPETAAQDAEFLNSLGWVLYREGDFEAAEEHLQRALSIESASQNVQIRVLNNLGSLYLIQGEYDAAVNSFMSASDLGSREAAAFIDITTQARGIAH